MHYYSLVTNYNRFISKKKGKKISRVTDVLRFENNKDFCNVNFITVPV